MLVLIDFVSKFLPSHLMNFVDFSIIFLDGFYESETARFEKDFQIIESDSPLVPFHQESVDLQQEILFRLEERQFGTFDVNLQKVASFLSEVFLPVVADFPAGHGYFLPAAVQAHGSCTLQAPSRPGSASSGMPPRSGGTTNPTGPEIVRPSRRKRSSRASRSRAGRASAGPWSRRWTWK